MSTILSADRRVFLEAVFESATDYAIIAIDTDGLVTDWNEGARRILGWTRTEMMGRPASAFFTNEDCANGIPQREMTAALDQGRGLDERWHLRKDRSVFWASGEILPLRTPAGFHLGFLKILRDRTTERLAAERNRADAEFLRGLLAASADCIKVLDLDARVTFMNEGGMRVMEVDDFETIHGRSWPDFWNGDANAEALAAVATARDGQVGHFRGMADTMAGHPRWWDVQVTPIPDMAGRPERLLVVSRDITKSVRIEEQARILADELQHRVKNNLAMVQAIVRQTLRTAPTPAAAQEAIDQRLTALGRAHTMLTQGGWTRSDLHSIVATALDLHDERTTRFKIEGPDVRLPAQAAMSLALLLHELATNAVKYGALSTPTGRVEIGWRTCRLDGDGTALQLDLSWQEIDGPPVTPPLQRGFGSKLIERSLASALRGTASIDFLNAGVICHVRGFVDVSAG